MRMRIPAFAAIGLLLLAGMVRADDEGCLRCHAMDEMSERGRQPTLLFKEGVHGKAGLNCSACHGGDSASDDFLVAHAKSAGFKGRPGPDEISKRCAACHDDAERMKGLGARDGLPTGQGRKFSESVHGQVVRVEGFERPSCVSCHGVHGIRSPTDPASPAHPSRIPETCDRCHGDLSYMRAFTSARVRVDQLIEYRTSTHGMRLAEGDMKVAVCSSCHGNHEILPASNPNSRVHPQKVEETCGKCHADPGRMGGYEATLPGGKAGPLPTDQLAMYRGSVHWKALHEGGDLSAPTCNDCHGNHGATPPEVRAVANICAQCHSRPADLFKASPLRPVIDDAGYPECATCHGNHRIERPDDALLERLADGVTVSGWVPDADHRALAREYLEGILKLGAAVQATTKRIEEVENYGMDLGRARLSLTQANDRLVQSRVSIHGFARAALDEALNGTEDEAGGLPLLAKATALADAGLLERSFRRKGLAVALGIILLVMAALIVKIRRMEAGRPSE